MPTELRQTVSSPADLQILYLPHERRWALVGLGTVAESELLQSARAREKTLEGLEAAARKGNVGGRPSVVDDDTLAVARARHAKGDSVTAIAKALGIGRATLYRHLGESA
ncbi:helix-turn-helix domain-containing protein [Streptomyces sp. NBC_01565]|uniref:helix-turn-helix domain-containing protein n=1 Tax=unclassified Streptomyces TaxID=2593676 RepID=UPI00224FD78B|nr:helix-turn-helix domain-containing protein [Streptomyces sp. NBC_01565]MCX4540383.1 helix-turn-helix domain-containing protein [Streptomyces sp. NBC_01565]